MMDRRDYDRRRYRRQPEVRRRDWERSILIDYALTLVRMGKVMYRDPREIWHAFRYRELKEQ